MTAFRNYIDGLPNPLFLLNETGEYILFSNQTAASEHGYDQDKKLHLSKFIKILPTEVSDQTLAQFNHKWFRLNRQKLTIEGNDRYILGLYAIEGHPDAETLENWKNMIAVLLHRLRSPLTGISGYIDLLKEENNDESLNHRFLSIEKGFDRVYNMMDDLEELYNIDVHFNTANFSPVNIPDFVNSLLLSCEREDQKRFHFHTNSSDGYTIETDRSFLRKLLLHLFENSLIHAEGEISIRYLAENGGSLYISNVNPGIPDEIKSKLFHPFVTTKANQLGIGLTMVLLYAQKLGGLVYFLEEEDQLTFVLQFPLK